ncbi:hypothetical protein [Hwangdonia seohaensis]|uniref:HTTM domain-containing protein n=1 Tax=Hwangdonia seohaensis TaxID=1240727 RepID=A0ABW3RAY9_9FLAO|nr:hypothetical protein [Hwangdonia seohaensis]
MNRLIDSFYEKFLNNFNVDFQEWIKIIVQITIVLITFIILHRGLFWATILPIEAYYENVIYFGFLKQLVLKPYLLIIVLVFIGFFNKKLLITWRDFGNNNLIRNFLIISTLLLTWFYATYDVNFFFNKVHYTDRILLVVLTLCVYWRPFFLFPYLTVLLAIIGQFEYLPTFSIATPPFLLIKILILFIVFYILKLVTNTFNPTFFLFMLGCLIATHYFTSGLNKFNIYWIFKDQISFLVPSGYANGWLSFLTAKTITDLTGFLSWFNIPLKLLTIAIECGMLLFFIHIKCARFLIFGAAIMHLGIFGFSGIFFWMWVVVLIASLFLFSLKKYNLNKIFNKKYFIISIVIIGGGRFWCQAKSLTWCDAPLSYTYKIYGETSESERYRLAPNFFSHYDYQFTLGAVKFWQEQPRLPITWGATNANMSNYFNTERSVKEIFEYEKLKGSLHKNAIKQKQYEDFLVQYLTNWNKKTAHFDNLMPIQAFPFYWTSPPSKIQDVKEKITRVVIVESTTFYSKKTGFREIRNQELKYLTIPNNQFKR